MVPPAMGAAMMAQRYSYGKTGLNMASVGFICASLLFRALDITSCHQSCVYFFFDGKKDSCFLGKIREKEKEALLWRSPDTLALSSIVAATRYRYYRLIPRIEVSILSSLARHPLRWTI